jgi:hypothetical protein
MKVLNRQTFYFTTDANHRVEFVYASSDKEVIPILVVRTILSQWMDQKATRGVRHELEASGMYEVKYTEPNKNELTRELLALEEDKEQFATMPGRSVVKPDATVKGQSHMTFDGDGHLQKVMSSRDTTSKFASRIVSRSFEQIELSLQKAASSDKPQEPDLNALTKLSIIARPDADESERALQAEELGKLSLDDILSLVPTKWTDSIQRTKVFLKLRALFYLKPDSCAEALHRVQASANQEQLVIDALAATGSVEAQKALMGLANRQPTNSSLSQQILVSLTQIPKPTADLQAFVCSLALNANKNRPVKYTAQLVCGSLAHRLSSPDAKKSSSINEFLDNELKGAVTDDDRLNLLYAIGNAARPEPSQLIVDFLRSTNPVLRAGAIHALRLTPGKNVDQIIADHLATEQVASVKREAQRVIDARKVIPSNPN